MSYIYKTPCCVCSAMVMTQDKQTMFCCTDQGRYSVSEYVAPLGSYSWSKIRALPSACKHPPTYCIPAPNTLMIDMVPDIV